MTLSPHTSNRGIVVRRGSPDDLDAVIAAVAALIRELSTNPVYTLPPGSLETARRLIGDPANGIVLTAHDSSDELIGLATASLRHAIRAGGPYAVLEELYVKPEWRSDSVGALLVAEIEHAAAQAGAAMIEVGLPRPAFPDEPRTRKFYEKCGFHAVGSRMRHQLVSSVGTVVAGDGLEALRAELDDVDRRIIERIEARFEIIRRIAEYKRVAGVPMMQPQRVSHVRQRYEHAAAQVGIPAQHLGRVADELIAAACELEDDLIERGRADAGTE